MPIRYRPGQAVTPPSWTTRPLRSSTGTSSQDRSGRYPVAQTIAPIWPDRRSRPSGAERTMVGANRSPAAPAQASIVFSSRPSFRSASAHTLGREPENWATPPAIPARRPASRTPDALNAFRSTVRPGEPTSCMDGTFRARARSSTSS